MGHPLIVLAVATLALGAAARSEAATSYTFNPTADAQVVKAYPTTSYGTKAVLSAKTTARETALRFQIAGLSGTVQSAKLRLWSSRVSADGPALYRSTGTWTEAVTWGSRPTKVGSAIADLGAIATGAYVEYNVGATVTANGTYEFIVAGGLISTFRSRESAHKPELVVVTTAAPPPPPPPPGGGVTVDVTLMPRAGVTGTQRVNFAVPFARGQLLDPTQIRVMSSGSELPAARRELAMHPDGSVRSVQIQVSTAVSAGQVLTIRTGEAPTTTAIAMADVSTTLLPSDGSMGPLVWARLPATWLADSGVAGPQVPEADVQGTAQDAWDNVCDYANHDVDDFLALSANKDVWLFDRGTTNYRGYARRGDQATLESAYRETALYRNGLTGHGTATRIGVPGSADDLKYHYSQNLAIHYLLTGDDRFRDSAEDVAFRAHALWTSPDYAGGSDFWTERHAGFALLAYTWAMIVSDDHPVDFEQYADDAVDAYLAVQAGGAGDANARCFGHTAAAHGEDYGTWGCSPWMSAILADGMDAYATEKGGADATAARASIVKLGKIIATSGRDSSGKPFYWLGVGAAADVVDDYDEHWGEAAYITAMAWHWGGRTDGALRAAADSLLAGLKANGESAHLRSFNWQCRSAIAAPWYLR
jgi:hypothetical protein